MKNLLLILLISSLCLVAFNANLVQDAMNFKKYEKKCASEEKQKQDEEQEKKQDKEMDNEKKEILDFKKSCFNIRKSINDAKELIKSLKNIKDKTQRKEAIANLRKTRGAFKECMKKFREMIKARRQQKKQEKEDRDNQAEKEIQNMANPPQSLNNPLLPAGVTALGIAKQCVKGLLKAIPGQLCFKDPIDLGAIPSKCPDGFKKKIAVCQQDCKSGFHWFLGACHQHCKSGFRNVGLTCVRNIFSWYFKKIYIPPTITCLDNRFQCADGTYKLGALCYKNCEKIGQKNCGPAACAIDELNCLGGMAKIAVNLVIKLMDNQFNVIEMIGDVVNPRNNFDQFSQLANDRVNEVGPNFLQSIFNILRDKLPGPLRPFMNEKAIEMAQNFMQQSFGFKLDGELVPNMCNRVTSLILDNFKGAKKQDFHFDKNDFSPLGHANVLGCNKLNGLNSQLRAFTKKNLKNDFPFDGDQNEMDIINDCAGGVFDSIKGIIDRFMVMSGAFAHPKCQGL